MDEAVWVKQALEKNQPGKPVRVINPDDESIRIFSWLADNFPDLQYFKLQLLDASNLRLTVSKQRNAITQQLIDNLIKGLLQTMPYASNISIAVLDDNVGNDSNLLIVFYVQIMPDDFVMQLHRF